MARRPTTRSSNYDMWTRIRLLSGSAEDAQSGCLKWQGVTSRGYGKISYRGRLHRAHRLFYELMVGPIPAGLELMHVCDNPRCINPNHLRAATHSENISDAYAKGRKSVAQGPNHPRFRLSAEQVDEAMLSHEPASALAERMGVSASVIYRLRNGVTWKSRIGGVLQ